MVKIESRPLVGHPWEYRFYLDLLTSPESAETQAALAELKERTSEVRILGCYPSAQPPHYTLSCALCASKLFLSRRRHIERICAEI